MTTPGARTTASAVATVTATATGLAALLAAIVLLVAPVSPAVAQPVVAQPVVAQPVAATTNAPEVAPLVPFFAPDPALLAAFGGKAGLARLSDVFVDRMRADPQIGGYFEKTKLPKLKASLTDQLCQLLAGPCVYDGDSMKASHADLAITRADSLRQVELLQTSMDELDIPFSVQNKLLARLAPMFRDIITR